MKLLNAWFAVLAMACALAVPACAGKPEVKPDPAKPDRAADTKRAHIQISFTGHDGGEKPDTLSGTVDLWFDISRGLYRFDITGSETKGDRVMKEEGQLIWDPDGYIVWEVRDGKVKNPHQRDVKTELGQEPALEQTEDLGTAAAVGVAFLDAAFGYKRLKSETTMKPAKSPLADTDNLRWQEIGEKADQKPDAEDSKLLHKLKLFGERDKGHAWLGIAPDTDWPMKYVVKGSRGEAMTFSVTKIDAKPDLKGVFDLPEDVKAKLEEQKKK